MDESEIADGGTVRRPLDIAPLLWAAAFGVLAALCLMALAWALWMMDVLATGAVRVLSPDTPIRVGSGYGSGAAAGAVLALLGAPALAAAAVLGGRGRATRWPAWLVGLLAALAGGTTGGTVMLLMLGISPLDVVRGL